MQEDGPAPAAPEPASADVPMEPVEEEIDEGELAKEALKAEVADGLAGARPDKAVVGGLVVMGTSDITKYHIGQRLEGAADGS